MTSDDAPSTAEPGSTPTTTSGDRWVAVTRTIRSSPETIFALLSDPSRHGEIDGSNTVKGARGENAPLELGSRFGMDMKLGLPYRMTNTVTEFEPNRRIAWCHFGGHTWRYVLEPSEHGTIVTETFDWSTAKFPPMYPIMGWPKRHIGNMERTLARLATAVE